MMVIRLGKMRLPSLLSFYRIFKLILLKFQTIWTLMNIYRKHPKRLWGNFWSSPRISDVEFWIGQLKPANVDNLQAEIAYVEQIAKIIAKSPSVTAQNSTFLR